MFNKNLTESETEEWVEFLKGLALSELRYAFEKWNSNSRKFPYIVDIRELCEAYRLSETTKLAAIGCERCDWSGFYTVRWNGIERIIAECPCRTNFSLRTKCTKELASVEELRAMYTLMKEMCATKKMPEKPRQISGCIPTSKELAEQLTSRKHLRFLGMSE